MKAPGTEAAAAGGLVDRIDALLPQTQCARCGYPSCREYAEALAAGLVDLNRCPPGGATTIAALAWALGLEPKPLDPTCGDGRSSLWLTARIDEAACIGCTLCIQACPVDAILGAAKRMHTVIESECTGCELCLDPCPVDCIALAPTSPGMDEVERSRQGLFLTIPCIPAIPGGQMPEPTHGDRRAQRNVKVADIFLQWWMRERAPLARRRFHARQQRLMRLRRARAERRRSMKRAAMPGRNADRAIKQAVIRAAVKRARHRGARESRPDDLPLA
jgi:electron transport complex protein RnfB